MNNNVCPDFDTYESLGENFSKDKNFIYYIKRTDKFILPEIEEYQSITESNLNHFDDQASFRLADETGSIYDSLDYEVIQNSGTQREKLAKDISSEIELMKQTKNISYFPLNGVDIESFQVLSQNYAKDKNTLYFENNPISKIILSPSRNEIEPITFQYYEIDDSLKIEINNIDSIEVIGHCSWGLLLKDKNYIYLLFEDENIGYRSNIKKIFHFPYPNNDTFTILDERSADCYLRSSSKLIYNYNRENYTDNFSVVEGVDFDSFESGGKDKNNCYEYGKIENEDSSKIEESISIEDIPF